MDNASVITYAGDLNLFEDLETSLVQAIPKEPTEWKRPYGRAVKSVYLDANFVPFSKDTVPKTGSWKLLGQPILHTYWTECNDVEMYKNTTKNDIEHWSKHLGGADWMIILVEVYDIRKSNKLLPRTTVLDKIRADFALKQGDRVLGLIHPKKSESKSAESWRGLVNRMRVLLLASYNKTLLSFEEAIRANRECRPQPNWSFCNYFTMQEEMALVLEMLGLHEEALVQYDELDALFTQFVVNSTKGETPKWLASFTVPLQQWAGPTLCQRVTCSQRDLLRCSKLDLLQFRSYLFGRQCSLLLLLCKPWEVAQRAVSFLHNSVQEMKILEVGAPEGAVATWVFLVCLEILHTCEKFTDSAQVQAYSLHTAGLWAYARDKLKQLGKLCGLAPGPGPTSEQLHTVVELSSGMGDPPATSSGPTPVDKLKEALSSKEAYNNYFLELSELAISTYKHIGRMRFARLIGMDLADLYLSLGQPDKAATFLTSALQGAQDDNWPSLAARIQLRAVHCFSDTSPDIKYTMSCAAIASSDVGTETKLQYYNKFIGSTKLFAQDAPTVTSIGEIGYIQKIEVEPRHQIRRGQCVISAKLDLFSRLPCPLPCTAISISVEKGGAESSQRSEEPPKDIFKRLPMFEVVEYKQDGSLNGASIICQEPQKALKRTDSQGRGRKLSTPLRKDFTLCLMTRNVVITPGKNSFNLSWTAGSIGRYLLGQLSVAVPGLELLELVASPVPELIVEKKKSEVKVQVCERELLAGLAQKVELILHTGSHFIIKGTPIAISCSAGLECKNINEAFAPTAEFALPETEPFEQFAIPFFVLAELPAQSDENSALSHQVTVSCGWCDVVEVTTLSFLTPLRSVMRLHSVAERKLLQVTMSGLSGTQLLLKRPQLQASGVDLIDKNTSSGQPMIIGSGLKGSFLWEMDLATFMGETESAPLTFSVQYSPVAPVAEADPLFYTYKCHFGICNFKTLFMVRCSLEAGKEADFCRVGAMCQLYVAVARCDARTGTDVALMYEVFADQAMWAICGRAAGVMTFEKETQQSVVLEVIPQTQGYLPLPHVRLFRYIPALDKESGRGEDSKPRLEPFSPGQVYSVSKSEQVHVLPTGSSE